MPETAQQLVNRILREFRRYTGDGLPGAPSNAPLPVGDPQSGVHSPKKAELRAALLGVLEANSSIIEVLASGGTANAQQAVVGENSNVDHALAYFMRVATENTGPMTLSVGGESPRAVVNVAGNPLSAGEWTGMVMFYLNEDWQYQLLIDAGAAASAAASASAAGADRIAAELARDQAQAAASSVSPTEYPTIAAAEALTPVSAPDFIRTAGHYDPDDGGGALYAKVLSEPSHTGKLSITLDDGVTVVWYEICVAPGMTPLQFGALGDGVTDDTEAWQSALDVCTGTWIDGLGKLYLVDMIFGHSHQKIKNTRFLKAPSNEDFTPALTFDGQIYDWDMNLDPSRAKTDIILQDVEVDGNRVNQTNILSPAEDGGRHGISFRGHVSDVYLVRVYAHHCATDGVHFGSRADANPALGEILTDYSLCFHNINLLHCRFEWNGRCGYSIDSIDGLKSVAGQYNDNGRDVNDDDPWDLSGGNQSSFGSRARTIPSQRLRFGRGWFWENYGIGTAMVNLLSVGDTLHRNSQGLLLQVSASSANKDSPRFRPSGDAIISAVNVDMPLNVSVIGPEPNFPAISITSPGAASDFMPIKNVQVSGKFQGVMGLRGVDNFRFDGDLNPTTVVANRIVTRHIGDYNIRVNKPRSNDVYAIDSIIPFRPTISAGANASDVLLTAALDLSLADQKIVKLEFEAVAVATGNVNVQITPPSGHIVEVTSVLAYVNSSGAPLAACVVRSGGSASPRTVTAIGATASQKVIFVATVAVRRQ